MEITHYEAIVQKLGQMLYPQEIQNVDLIELSAPLIKMKIKTQWEDWARDWEVSHPEMGRAEYMADPKKLHSQEIMEG